MEKIYNNSELWETTYRWLKLCGSSVNAEYCKEEISTHPDYPALTSLIDFLDIGSMSYFAVKADAQYISEFNYPVLAHIHQPGQEYMHIIPNVEAWEEQKEITRHWSGIVISPEEKASWYNAHNSSYEQNSLRNKKIAMAFALVGLLLLILTFYQNPNLLVNIFGLLSFTGILISTLLLSAELGVQNSVVKQVCSTLNESGCEQVLKSSYARGFWGITPANASLAYFTTQFILYNVASLEFPIYQNIYVLAICGCFVAPLSIYIQAVKLKQWCGLCLAVVLTLVMQAIIATINIEYSLSYTGFYLFAVLFILLIISILPIKRLVEMNNSYKLKLSELKKWKLDASLFMNQWQQEQNITTASWQNDIILGSSQAPLLITVACNPYCLPCARTHKQLDALIERFGHSLNVQIRWFFPTEGDNRFLQATKAILQKAAEGIDKRELQNVMNTWFECMDLKKWIHMWRPDLSLDVTQELEQHRQWVEQSRITSTPTLFLNGKKLPGRYTLYDLEFLIPQLAGMMHKESEDVALL